MIHTSMFQKKIHKLKFYPSADDFTQALLVMLVTNIMSASAHPQQDISKLSPVFPVPFHPGRSLRCRQRHTAEKSNEACPPLERVTL